MDKEIMEQFELIKGIMNERFEQIDNRFDKMQGCIDGLTNNMNNMYNEIAGFEGRVREDIARLKTEIT